jgi:hypothetical protein
MIRNRDMEHTIGRMAGSMRDTGMTESSTAKVNLQIAKESVSMGNGIMESVYVG